LRLYFTKEPYKWDLCSAKETCIFKRDLYFQGATRVTRSTPLGWHMLLYSNICMYTYRCIDGQMCIDIYIYLHIFTYMHTYKYRYPSKLTQGVRSAADRVFSWVQLAHKIYIQKKTVTQKLYFLSTNSLLPVHFFLVQLARTKIFMFSGRAAKSLCRENKVFESRSFSIHLKNE